MHNPQQTGAAIRGRTIRVSERVVPFTHVGKGNALEMMRAESRKEVCALMMRVLGKNVNPFLSDVEKETDSRDPGYAALSVVSNGGDPGCAVLPVSDNCKRIEAENVLQGLIAKQIEVDNGILILLQTMNEVMLNKAKRMLANSLTRDEATWNLWHKYVGCQSLNEEAEAAMEEWWELVASCYDNLANILLENSSSETWNDIELGLKEWRNFSELIKAAADYEEYI